jgi:hypothetical protein
MKRIPLFIFLVISTHAISQTEKGATLVGGAISLQTTKNNSNFTVTPNIGFFAANNFAIGGSMNLVFSKLGDVKSNQLGVGPYLRYYIGKTQTKPFIITEGNYLSTKFESVDPVSNLKTETTSTGVGFLFGLGFAAFVNDVVAVEGLTGYNYSDFKGISGSGGFTMRLGFQLYFNKKSYSDLKTNVLGQ